MELLQTNCCNFLGHIALQMIYSSQKVEKQEGSQKGSLNYCCAIPPCKQATQSPGRGVEGQVGTWLWLCWQGEALGQPGLHHRLPLTFLGVVVWDTL